MSQSDIHGYLSLIYVLRSSIVELTISGALAISLISLVYLPVLAVFFHVLHVDLTDFLFSINIILVNIPGAPTAKPAGRTVLTTATAIERILYYLLTLFFSCVLDKDRFHRLILFPSLTYIAPARYYLRILLLLHLS